MLFRFDRTDHQLDSDHAEGSSGEIMRGSTGRNVTFNDLQEYWGLKAQAGCTRVELLRVHCRHNDFVMGLQAEYRSFFSDGSTRDTVAEPHFFELGFYSFPPGKTSTLELGSNEYIVDVQTRQGEIVDCITFVTNMRKISFGGLGGGGEEERPLTFTRRVIAFAGTEDGVLHRVGFFALDINWEIVKGLILLRYLVKDQRASFDCLSQVTKDQIVLATLVTHSGDDIFKYVLSFLAAMNQ